ncbi:class I SAM-dependent methyltransferase [Pandoraea communis]|uniref:class I SAM-dependent methyltransferase n=1 Tax=Pandoraea communis TaxID=2508297 RepID=UPI0025A647C5|nr:class I SAM-dependent methyltransferase [Pandoraea communis]MDM8356550.1 class I SAM-dependent methyltransferase [Pandoraea communis]
MFEHQLALGIGKNVDRILRARADWANKTVVDLACGDGRTTYILRNLGATVKPFDIMPEYCKLDGGADYANIMDGLPIESSSVDVVVLQEVIEHLPNHLAALQEISRILKPGGELFLTTPNRSSMASKLAYLCFESEIIRGTPASAMESVWGEDGERKYYGHLFLMGAQQLRTLSMLAGFTSMQVYRSDKSRTSQWLMVPFYPVVYAASYRAYRRALRKSNCANYAREKYEQLKLNVDGRILTNKFLIASLTK